jgi:hypothetical protein
VARSDLLFQAKELHPKRAGRKSQKNVPGILQFKVNGGPTGIADESGRFYLLDDQLFSKENVPVGF